MRHLARILQRQYRILFLWAVLASASVPAQELGLFEPSPQALQEFQRFLETIADRPLDSIITALQQYAQKNPTQERAHWYLLDFMAYRGDLAGAEAFFRRQLELAAARRNSWWMLARIHRMSGRPDAALSAYREAFRIGPPSFIMLDNFAEFLRTIPEAEARKQLDVLDTDAASRAIVRAEYVRRAGAFDSVLTLLTQEVPGYAQDKYLLHLAGFTHHNLGNNAEAASLLERGLQICRIQNDRFLETFYRVSMPSMGLSTADAPSFREMLALTERMADLRLEMIVKLHSEEYMADKPAALTYLQRAGEIAVKIYDDASAGRAYLQQALIFANQQHFNEALRTFVAAETYIKQSNHEPIRCDFHLERGGFFIRMHLTKLARRDYEAALAWARKKPAVKLNYRALSRLADLDVEEEKFDRAISLYQSFLQLPPASVDAANRVYWRYKLAQAYRLQGRYAAAETELRQIIQASDGIENAGYRERMKAYSWMKLAEVYTAQGASRKAVQMLYDENFTVPVRRHRDIQIERLHAIGKAYRQLGQLDSAIAILGEAARQVEDNRTDLNADELRIGYFSGAGTVYDDLIDCLYQRFLEAPEGVDLNDIYTTLEMRHARVLRDLKLAGSPVARLQNDPLYANYRRASEELQEIQRTVRFAPESFDSLKMLQLSTARYQLIDTRLQLLNKHSRSARQMHPPELKTIVASMAGSETSLLFYHIGDGGAMVLVVNKGKARLVPLPVDRMTLARQIDTLTSGMYGITQEQIAGIPFHADVAHRLYQSLIQPVEAVLDLEQRLWIIPDLLLAGLPFSMLLREPAARKVYYPGDLDTDYAARLLLQRYAVVIGPSAWLSRARPEEMETNVPGIAVFANPYSLDTQQGPSYQLAVNQQLYYFEPLNYAGEEADSIREYFPDAHIFKYEQANLPLLQKVSGEVSILHFASHAFIDPEFGAFSGLLLYPDIVDFHDDGLLTGYKIADLILNCDLVCLSACETARGQAVRGEGIIGMPRLFLAAGARRVLMTRWIVSDRYNSIFMPQFYKGFLTRQESKAVALQASKLRMLSRTDREGRFSYAHPFFWAGLTLYGEPDVRGQNGGTYWITILLVVLLILALAAAAIWFRKRRKV